MKRYWSLIYCLFSGSIAFCNLSKDTIILITNTIVEVRYPEGPISGTILVLPGWNFSQDDICIHSDMCTKANKAGYILIMPDMRKSIYQDKLYPETRQDWRIYHTRYWLIDTLIPFFQQKYGILLPGNRNFLLGISTGGRGVAMMAIYTKRIFCAGAALSGDFNQERMTKDNLMKGYYGAMEAFPERWSGTENPSRNVASITIPLLLAHGKDDPVVPYWISQRFYDQLCVANPKLHHHIVLKEGAGHNYMFWSGMMEDVLDFFKLQQ